MNQTRRTLAAPLLTLHQIPNALACAAKATSDKAVGQEGCTNGRCEWFVADEVEPMGPCPLPPAFSFDRQYNVRFSVVEMANAEAMQSALSGCRSWNPKTVGLERVGVLPTDNIGPVRKNINPSFSFPQDPSLLQLLFRCSCTRWHHASCTLPATLERSHGPTTFRSLWV